MPLICRHCSAHVHTGCKGYLTGPSTLVDRQIGRIDPCYCTCRLKTERKRRQSALLGNFESAPGPIFPTAA
jgi:hypothetical protein